MFHHENRDQNQMAKNGMRELLSRATTVASLVSTLHQEKLGGAGVDPGPIYHIPYHHLEVLLVVKDI